MIATFVVGFWVIRHLGPASFGELCIIRAVQGILNVLATMGLTQLLPIKLASRQSTAAETILTAALVRFGGAIFSAFASVPILCWIQGYTVDDWQILGLASLLLLISPAELLEAWFVSQTKTRFTVLSRMVSVVLTSTLQVLAITCGFGLVAFLAIDFLALLIYGGMLAIFMLSFLRPQGSPVTDINAVTRLVRESLPIWLSAGAAIISVRVDQAMLGMMLGKESTGLYAAAARLS